MIHIHNPEPIQIIDGKDLKVQHHEYDRFGRELIYADGCCRKMRLLTNCNIRFYEWYEPMVVCKDGKGCKK